MPPQQPTQSPVPPQQPPTPPPAPVAPPPPPPTPAPVSSGGHAGLMWGIALVLLLALAAGGGYFAWSQGMLDPFIPVQSEEPELPAMSPPSETSDIEVELERVEMGADAELEGYESQL